MLNPQVNYFIERWLIKANNYNPDSLEDHFDRFFSLFVAYNRLYNELDNKLKRKSGRVKNKGDKEKATKQIRKFLRHEIGLNNFISSLNNNKIQELADVIEEHFNIHVYNGTHLSHKDTELLSNLRSNNLEKKTIAVLDTLYHVRCNMFHGEKSLSDKQELLLLTLNDFLEQIISIVKECLNKT